MSTDREAILASEDRGHGLSLVFIHGFPFSSGCWQPQLDDLAGSFRTLAVDLPGFGASAAVEGESTIDGFADQVAGTLEALGTGPVVLVGFSMGGYVALAFARRHAERLAGLVLVGTRAGADSAEAVAGRHATAEKVSAAGPAELIAAMAPKMLAAENRNPASVAAVEGLMAAASRAGVVGALRAMASRPDSTPGLADILVPTLVIAGAADDVIPPAESESMAAAIPGAGLRIVDHAGHLVAWERPEVFNRELRSWLSDRGLA